jgi:Phage integrase SAM-like domain
MASIYKRGDIYWIAFRNATGKRILKSTGLRHSNPAERVNVKRLCAEMTLQEQLQSPATAAAANWDWVEAWMATKWGTQTSTLSIYRSRWRRLAEWLLAIDVPGPVNLTREHCLAYVEWRIGHSVSRNTAVLDLKLMHQVLGEAVRRGYIKTNPAEKLGLKHGPAVREKRAWTDKELATVDSELKERDRFGWMRVTFLLGRYQAARLRQCAATLDDIHLEWQPPTIYYPAPKGGEAKAYSQPIDKRLLTDLSEIVNHRRSIGATTLCDIPFDASVQWRQFLDELRITGVSHHSLRATWVTKAALSGIPESVAQRFSNHSSNTVHRIYQRFTSADMATMLERLA